MFSGTKLERVLKVMGVSTSKFQETYMSQARHSSKNPGVPTPHQIAVVGKFETTGNFETLKTELGIKKNTQINQILKRVVQYRAQQKNAK